MRTDASQIIARELEAGESLIWSGQPRKGLVFRSSDVLLIPFSLMWGGFAIFWEASALSIARKRASGPGTIFPLFGIPFVLIGLYLIFGRFIVDALQRGNTYYGLTDRRVIIVTGIVTARPSLNLITLVCSIVGLARHQLKSLDLRTLNDISMTERSDGSGTITFGAQNPNSFFATNGWPNANRAASPSFDPIEHVKSVYQQIRSAQRTAS